MQADYPGSSQVALLGLEKEADRKIWDYAKACGYVIVTRDSDFHELSLLFGAPPRIIWLKTGNQSKASVLSILCEQKEAIEKVLDEDGKACIEIYG